MFEIKLINPHKQFGTFCCSLLFHDTSNGYPDVRWEKKYPANVTKAQVAADVKRTLKAWAVEQGLTITDVQMAGVSYTIDQPNGTQLTGTF